MASLGALRQAEFVYEESVHPETVYADIARHWEHAGDALEAAKWHRRAAKWVGLNNPAEALRH